MNKINVSFLLPFLKDEALLSWDETPALDLTRKARNVLHKLKDDPISLTEKDVKDVVWDKDSQIGNKDAFWQHITDVSYIYRDLTEKLLSIDDSLDLPDPETARVRGLIHDLDSTYTRYGGEFRGHEFVQHEKQLTEYFHFRGLGLDQIAREVPMHCAYFGILEMIAAGEGFPEVEMYKDWTKALNDPENPINFENIQKDFNLFLQGKDIFPLIVLAVSDYLDNGKPNFSVETMDYEFKTRRDDILARYYHDKVNDGKTPSVLGKALVEKKGVERIENYFGIVKDLLAGNGDKYKEAHGLWK